MAGRIKAEDVALVKERSRIEDVVSEHVTLRGAGVGALKGLCPFHDEKSPSFNVRPAYGTWHCFGCGEGGDVISFVQKVEHLSFAESIERLAGKLGMELHYEEGGRPREEGLGRRSRLVEAHRVAAEFYGAALVDLPEARAARDFLRQRRFDRAAAERFAVGFSPRQGEALTRHLRAKGFGEEEILAAGLAARGSRGLYDRFRGRLMWPIRDITGDAVGFGARRIFDDDRIEAKYLNTSETTIYKKSSVLYGLDAAKKAIARDRQAVVVEGYTDVMACHLAGVETAVATCGTAFGLEHIKSLRRIMRDEQDTAPARVVFTFDGDAAGQKAAMRAFADDQKWASQSFVAVERSGMDPCELRQSAGDLAASDLAARDLAAGDLAAGDQAVRDLIDDAVPMFEFAVRTTIGKFDLDTAEGRVQALQAAAPIIARIRDGALRPEYVRTVAGWLGVEVEQVSAEVGRASRMATRHERDERSGRSGHSPSGAGRAPGNAAARTVDRTSDSDRTSDRDRDRAGDRAGGSDSADDGVEEAFVLPRPDMRDPVVFAERQLLQSVLQFPRSVDAADLAAIDAPDFTAPAHRAVFDAISAAGGLALAAAAGVSSAAWVDRVLEASVAGVRPLVSELTVAPLPVRFDPDTGLPERRYVTALVIGVQESALGRRIADGTSSMLRLSSADEPDAAAVNALRQELYAMQRTKASLRARLS